MSQYTQVEKVSYSEDFKYYKEMLELISMENIDIEDSIEIDNKSYIKIIKPLYDFIKKLKILRNFNLYVLIYTYEKELAIELYGNNICLGLPSNMRNIILGNGILLSSNKIEIANPNSIIIDEITIDVLLKAISHNIIYTNKNLYLKVLRGSIKYLDKLINEVIQYRKEIDNDRYTAYLMHTHNSEREFFENSGNLILKLYNITGIEINNTDNTELVKTVDNMTGLAYKSNSGALHNLNIKTYDKRLKTYKNILEKHLKILNKQVV